MATLPSETLAQGTAETFVWRHGAQIVGRLSVPKGPAVERYDYREGIVTTLRYKDGAYIVLQVGGMYRLPLFRDPEYKLLSSTKHETETTRVGRLAGELYWREDNYKPGKAASKRSSYLATWPPNIGYAKVRPEQRVDFDNALNSFIREIDRIIPPR